MIEFLILKVSYLYLRQQVLVHLPQGSIRLKLDVFERLLRTAMERSASDKICEELQTFFEVNTKALLEYIAGENVLGPYLPKSTSTTLPIDPLQYEDIFIQNLMINKNKSDPQKITTTELFNLREQDPSTGRWINKLIEKGVTASNEIIPNVMVDTYAYALFGTCFHS